MLRSVSSVTVNMVLAFYNTFVSPVYYDLYSNIQTSIQTSPLPSAHSSIHSFIRPALTFTSASLVHSCSAHYTAAQFRYSHAVPSPRCLTLTCLPLSPTALITWGSPGTRSIAESPHCTSSAPSTSRTIPLMGKVSTEREIESGDTARMESPREETGGKVMYLKGSGLEW